LYVLFSILDGMAQAEEDFDHCVWILFQAIDFRIPYFGNHNCVYIILTRLCALSNLGEEKRMEESRTQRFLGNKPSMQSRYGTSGRDAKTSRD
jgi:hypothetical protein